METDPCGKITKAMIFAAGLGTRLKPLTDSMPKALVPVDGKPLLEHVIRKLKNAGIEEAVVNIHHFPDQIKDFLSSKDLGIRIKISDERDLLRETGGGLSFARPLLVGRDYGLSAPERFLIHNVDILSNLDIRALASKAREDAISTVVVSSRKTERYFLFNNEMRLMGWTNIKTGEVKSPWPGLDPSTCRKFAFAGIHLISDKIFDAFKALDEPERFSITDFYIRACREWPIYGYVPEDFRLMDVGKAETLSAADEFCRDLER